MLAEVSFSFFFFSLLSGGFKKAYFEQMLLSILRRLIFDGKWFKNPQTTSRRLKKKKIKFKRLKDDTFLRFFEQIYVMRKSSKMSALKQRFLTNFH